MAEQLNDGPNFNEMVAKKISRRNILKLTAFAGASAAAGTTIGTALAGDEKTSAANAEGGGRLGAPGAGSGSTPPPSVPTPSPAPTQPQIGFTPIAPSTADDLVLAPGFRYTVVRSWGDPVADGETFGFNNDYIAYFPIDLLQGGNSSSDGLLWVNHEYVSQMFVSGHSPSVNPTYEQYKIERAAVGGSIIRIKKNASGTWEFVNDPTYNRRITGFTMIDLDGPAAGSAAVKGATEVMGTVGNCAGGITPWGTALSAEENYQDYGPDASKAGSGWAKSDTDDRSFIDEHFGWIVEIDPFDKSAKPVKHTALGRFRHEGATVAIGNSGKVVVYSGYDRVDYPVYKFISDGVYNPSDRAANKKLLSSGKLYAADFGTGKWLDVDISNPKIAEKYKTQAEVLVDASEAAILAGATRTDRPEDIKINPADKSIFIAFTNNAGHGNYHGHITRIVEANNNHESLDFAWEVFATGGPQKESNFSSPDNLIFDGKGNLWVFTDISSRSAAKGIYKTMGNNGIFVIPTTGPNAGVAYQFGSSPIEAETTGPFWTPDGKTLFLSIQHPGEESPSMDKLSSHWPGGGSSIPKPSIVAITGF